ncbi:MAG: helix-turn-helix domain-containing protein [Clostridia bacterium]|nr:helix-turn-helix domain-containing protein [Clostridia bacterium]
MSEEIRFKSSLTTDEIEENFENFDFYNELVNGLDEAIAYEKGKAHAETFARKKSLPNVKVVEIRRTLDMTQRSFAALLGVSKRTVEAWESGKSTPTPTAKKLMYLIEQDHSLVKKLCYPTLKN